MYPRPAGVTTEQAPGEIFTPSPVISRTNLRRGTREAAIESSYHDDYNPYFNFS